MKSNESAEDYLETILILEKKKPVVRSVDIAKEIGYKKSSVSVAMKNLYDRGHVTITDEGYILLTETGREIAESIYERHILISDWLMRVGVSEKTALEDACRIEHYISEESFAAVKKYANEHIAMKES